jgi:hypothetical protein
MTANLAYNYLNTINAPNTFNVTSVGHIVGTMMDDPVARFALAGGVLSQNETLPMWGGVAIYEDIGGYGTNPPAVVLGSVVGRATSMSGGAVAGTLAGWSVFNQAHAMVNTPQSPVPLAGSGMSVNFLRLGSGARITVQIDPTLAASLAGDPTSQPVSWDFVNQQIVTYQAAYATNVCTNSTWASTGGGQATFTTTSPHGVAVGSYVTISGAVPAAYNGTWLAITGTASSTIVVNMPVNPGTISTEGSLVAGGGALPVKVLGVEVGNSMTVSYNATTQAATWNYSGNTALILI